ncbi:hypothetical protein EV175_003569, partial [Coemansia sp. RSA 1933]
MRPSNRPTIPSLEDSNEGREEPQEGLDINQQYQYQTPDSYAHRGGGDVEMMSVDSNDPRLSGGPRLGAHYTGEYTPPSQVAAGAVGRRLDLAMPPRFALAPAEVSDSVGD